MRLQGKRNRGKEEVKFLEIKGDDQLIGSQQWMTKSMSEEKQERQSFSKVPCNAVPGVLSSRFSFEDWVLMFVVPFIISRQEEINVLFRHTD